MSKQNITVTINILDREYQISCPAEEEQGLKEAAAYMHEEMQRIRDKGSVIGSDRLAVIAALNITHEFLKLKSLESDYESISERICTLRESAHKAIDANSDA